MRRRYTTLTDKNYSQSYFEREEGQDLIEYALIAGLLALAAVAALIALGGSLQSMWTQLSTQVNSAIK